MTGTLPPLTSAELSDLKAKAKAATPGPWYDANDKIDVSTPQGTLLLASVYYHGPIARHANAPYIAAANPETILRLIDMIERRDVRG